MCRPNLRGSTPASQVVVTIGNPRRYRNRMRDEVPRAGLDGDELATVDDRPVDDAFGNLAV